jgi:hypothetical protein
MDGSFPLIDGDRSIPAAPGARKAAISTADVAELVRDVQAHLDREGLAGLFAPLDVPAEDDPDPDLAPVLGLCGPRLLPPEGAAGLAILPPSRRFNLTRRDRVYRMFAAGPQLNGYHGYALAPSALRPGLAVWTYSDSGLMEEGEFGPVADWLAEALAPLKQSTLADPAQRAGSDAALAGQAEELWQIIDSDLPPPQPRPGWVQPGDGTESGTDGWHGELAGGRAHGEWTRSRHGVVVCRETYAGGLRHGRATWWHLAEGVADDWRDRDRFDDDMFTYSQGPVEREGTFVRGAAHGHFRFCNDRGDLLQEGGYEHGWPHGTWQVYPEATTGIGEPASVEYDAGVPVRWTIPPLAFRSVLLRRANPGRHHRRNQARIPANAAELHRRRRDPPRRLPPKLLSTLQPPQYFPHRMRGMLEPLMTATHPSDNEPRCL